MHNVFVIDPGTKSGLAWTSVRSSGTVRERLLNIPIYSATVDGTYVEQADKIVTLFVEHMAQSDSKKFHVVIEDFILREFTKDRELLDPVRVTSAVVVAIEFAFRANNYNIEIDYQSSSAALTYATNERLRNWQIWLPGSNPDLEHQRDARRHLALWVARQIEAQNRRFEGPS